MMKIFITLVPGSFGAFSQTETCLCTCIEADANRLEGTSLPESFFDLTNNPAKYEQCPWPKARSLSVGDIVIATARSELHAEISKAWICAGMGWKEATAEDIGKRLFFTGNAYDRTMKFRA